MKNNNSKINSYIFPIIIDDAHIDVLCSNHVFIIQPVKYDSYAFHFHTCFELFFIGKSPIKIITENTETEHSNSITVIPPLLMHYSQHDGNIYCLSFTFRQGFKKTKLQTDFEKLLGNGVLSIKYDNSIINYINDLNNTLSDKYIDESEISALLYIIFKKIFKSLNLLHDQIYYPKSNYLETIEAFIFKCFNQKIKISDLAREMNLSTKQTARIIKEKYNKSFTTLINEQRLSFACYMLAKNQHSITKIIEISGFENESYFYRLFKHHIGCTPHQYRKITTEH